MGVWLGPMGSPVKFIGQDDFIFSGTSQYASSDTNWEIALKTSGTLKFKKNPGPIDAFLVGGGQAGSNGSLGDNQVTAIGGRGGDGGKRKTETNIEAKKNKEYVIVVGTSGNDSSITIGGTAYSSSSGTKSNGGYGANCTQGGTKVDAPAPGTTNGPEDGDYAFGISGTLIGGGTKYGASGGGGAAGRRSDYARGARSNGGTTGGGAGGYIDQTGLTTGDPVAGTANTGSGGGGGWAIVESYGSLTSSNGAVGGNGIIIIRNHRSS